MNEYIKVEKKAFETEADTVDHLNAAVDTDTWLTPLIIALSFMLLFFGGAAGVASSCPGRRRR